MTRQGGGWSLQVNRPYSWAWADTFTADECERIINFADSDLTDGVTLDGKSGHRRSSVRFLYPEPQAQWMFERITGIVTQTNDEYFGFDLTALIEGFQFTRYESPSGHYDWHCDMAANTAPRKLSLTIQLSDPDNYIGGDLQLSRGGAENDIEVMSRERGRAFLFPSWMPHRVTPVTEGVRYSLVAWVTGPPFR